MLDIVSIACVFEVDTCERVCTRPAVASLVFFGRRRGNIHVFGAHRLEAPKRLDHHLVLLSAITGCFELFIPLRHIFLVEARRYNHFTEAHFFFFLVELFVIHGVILLVPGLLLVLYGFVVERGVQRAQ